MFIQVPPKTKALATESYDHQVLQSFLTDWRTEVLLSNTLWKALLFHAIDSLACFLKCLFKFLPEPKHLQRNRMTTKCFRVYLQTGGPECFCPIFSGKNCGIMLSIP
ncbi:hypothetical protein CDAR_38591 [Caerostris darwini]|uniref:Uncharacterized protein n=1 Tax=Caerostris darwini TaxID=1538125 RepID=A0AAV4UQM0_9ARAC|nr:hypothetical protein CDAR_38591 [Caerostris darwini]